MGRLMKHARAAANTRRWHWIWRKLHALSETRPNPNRVPMCDEWMIDVGYCLDRYTVDDPKEEPQ